VPRFAAFRLACLLLAASAGAAHGEVLRYAGYIAGLKVIEIAAVLRLDDASYRLETRSRTLGVADIFSHSDFHLLAQGNWRGDAPQPVSYSSQGVWHSRQSDVLIDYATGAPEVTRLLPTTEEYPREKVPTALQATGMDGLSVAAGMLRRVAQGNQCAGIRNIFDGRRFSRLAALDGAGEVLEPESRSMFSGPTLRCEIETVLVAGLPLDPDRAEDARRPNHIAIWFARATASRQIVPVKISAEMRLFGHMTLYLSAVEPGDAL
jgi:hypothetical protein